MKRSGIAAALLLVLVLLTVACLPLIARWFAPERTIAEATGVSDALVAAAVKWRLEDGSFVLPEDRAAKVSDEVLKSPSYQAHAAFTVSDLLGERSSEALQPQSRDHLARIAGDRSEERLVRLEAGAALKAAGDTRAAEAEDAARQPLTSSGVIASTEDLLTYMPLADAAMRLDPDLDLARLALLQEPASPEEGRIFAGVLAQDHLFSNREEIRNAFPRFQRQLLQWALDSQTSVDQFLISSVAVQGGGVVSLGQNDVAAIQSRRAALPRCDDGSPLVAPLTDDRSFCSAALTAVERRLP